MQISSNSGRVSLDYSDRTRLLSVMAPGYQPLQTRIEPGSSNRLTTIWLDPQTSGRQKTLNACRGHQICGWVRDADTLMALESVTLSLAHRTVQTDGNGFFRLPASESYDTLTVSLDGYRSSQWSGIDSGSTVQMVIDLRSGQGSDHHDLRHPLGDASLAEDWLAAKQFQQPSALVSDVVMRERPGGSIYMAPPTSIRVGFDATGGYCCGGNCSTSQVFSLETYVQRGLDNEWISSWQTDSLKAGTVPFRSYGAWHVLNPPYTGYDICAGPCCQAFEFTGFSSTIAAGEATNGIMLELNGNLARSEYSAENNSWNDPDDGLSCTNADLSCGDGFVGSPSTGWPCLDDDSEGRGCFGHGRGMSQWGTQFRALTGESWADIIDHYYNASGNPSGNRGQYATSPLRLDDASSDLSSVLPGGLLMLQFDLFNAADSSLPFGPVMLGASLISDTIDYSDPANDAVYSVTSAGAQSLDRLFNVPANADAGLYDLAVALWLDVDGDLLVTSADWVLAFERFPDMITVLPLGDDIFMDSFE